MRSQRADGSHVIEVETERGRHVLNPLECIQTIEQNWPSTKNWKAPAAPAQQQPVMQMPVMQMQQMQQPMQQPMRMQMQQPVVMQQVQGQMDMSQMGMPMMNMGMNQVNMMPVYMDNSSGVGGSATQGTQPPPPPSQPPMPTMTPMPGANGQVVLATGVSNHQSPDLPERCDVSGSADWPDEAWASPPDVPEPQQNVAAIDPSAPSLKRGREDEESTTEKRKKMDLERELAKDFNKGAVCVLVGGQGVLKDKRFAFTNKMSKAAAGRTEENTIVLNTKHASKKHAKFIVMFAMEGHVNKRKRLFIQDLSTNGTFVNKRRTKKDKWIQLDEGDSIDFINPEEIKNDSNLKPVSFIVRYPDSIMPNVAKEAK